MHSGVSPSWRARRTYSWFNASRSTGSPSPSTPTRRCEEWSAACARCRCCAPAEWPRAPAPRARKGRRPAAWPRPGAPASVRGGRCRRRRSAPAQSSAVHQSRVDAAEGENAAIGQRRIREQLRVAERLTDAKGLAAVAPSRIEISRAYLRRGQLEQQAGSRCVGRRVEDQQRAAVAQCRVVERMARLPPDARPAAMRRLPRRSRASPDSSRCWASAAQEIVCRDRRGRACAGPRARAAAAAPCRERIVKRLANQHVLEAQDPARVLFENPN